MWIGANMTSYGLDEWFWAMFELTWTWPNLTFGQFFMLIGANNGQISLSMGYTSDSEQCSNWLQLDLILLVVNFSCVLAQIMTIMTSYGLDEWFWAMFELTWTWPNFTFGQLVMWIGANNDEIWLPVGYTSDSEQCSDWLELDLISLLVNFPCELQQIMTRYDFLWARRVILSNVWTDLNFT